jgi:hypothetical protein
MAKTDIITEYEAAAITAMSPELLKWLTSYAPKYGNKRKLKTARVVGDAIFYERDEVIAFNAWLKQPWPRKNGKRPGIPTQIREEIRVEANGACAICQQHQGACEAAHLDPVAKTDNNHPENLLWLCATHHTVYDKGFFKPIAEEAEFVAGFKIVLTRFKVQQWRMQHDLSVKIFSVLETCELLEAQLAKANTREQVDAVNAVAERTLAAIPALAPVSKADPKHAAYTALNADVAELRTSVEPVKKRLRLAKRVREQFVATYGYVACPVCEASGRHDGSDCPVCRGDREIEKTFADGIDVAQYAKVECPLCQGEGEHDHELCPACGGEGAMDKRYADYVEVRDYELIDCTLCEGEGRYEGEDCPVCRGEREITRQLAQLVDLRQYETVDCPLCEGEGRWEGNDCPECRGHREMQQRYASEVNLRGYQKVQCPLCRGTGEHRDYGCPVCDGAEEIDRSRLDWIDMRQFDIVSCPVCAGHQNRYHDCRACDGQGEMERRHAQQIDPRDFE